MLTKCTNPSCSVSFSHLAEGRLFRLEANPPFGLSWAKTTEYFWLCEHCAAGMTLRLAQDGRVVATELREAIGDGPRLAYAAVNHQRGLSLSSVTFLCSSDSSEARKNPTVETHGCQPRDDIVAAASSCPVADCSSLVIEYRAASSIRCGHPEDWLFTCPRCGTEFTVTQGELIFQSVPKQWLSGNTHLA